MLKAKEPKAKVVKLTGLTRQQIEQLPKELLIHNLPLEELKKLLHNKPIID